jgi:hypothetical protein
MMSNLDMTLYLVYRVICQTHFTSVEDPYPQDPDVLGLPDPDPFVIGTDLALDLSLFS